MGRKSRIEPAIQKLAETRDDPIKWLMGLYEHGFGFTKLAELIVEVTRIEVSAPTVRTFLVSQGLKPRVNTRVPKVTDAELLRRFKASCPAAWKKRLTFENEECVVNRCSSCFLCNMLLCGNFGCPDRPPEEQENM